MARFPTPSNRPPSNPLLPVHAVTVPDSLEFFMHARLLYAFLPFLVRSCLHPWLEDLPTQRPFSHFPQRTHWCGQNEVHAMVYHPTHEFCAMQDNWITPPNIFVLAGQPFDLFVNRKNLVHYTGIYTLHGMRDVHPPGSAIPADVSPDAIRYAAGLRGDSGSAGQITKCFPDGQIKTECFGLQCLGFDYELYNMLRQRFTMWAVQNPKKRRQDGEELRECAHVKPRPV